MTSIWTGPVAWAATQTALLAALMAAGLGVVAGVAGTTYAVVVAGLLIVGLRRSGRAALGPADHVTEARTLLVGLVTALIVESFTGPVSVPLLVSMAAVALALDAVDGRVARRTGTASSFGARFDIEADSFLALVLAVYVAGTLGPWVLAIGLMRYLFLAAGYAMPWLNAPLPVNRLRKLIGAMQGIVLVVAAAGIVPTPVMLAITAFSLAAQLFSFGRDVIWLRRTALHA
ncbi:CDP-alcohol phosphatidyltransferase family protein [Tenggerimyces flavus]|uniref:CDP-alcohol phosphatidyltransferase family protein n=1 Tax=Tenggerimyces flavus TaxID=1708749 RepID=A0ABV7YFP2_9ACTN|nr:CDP-alcohol phosphatidyltransferase family protein [Tenggerimyces flavus]MBM7788032.1 phosphatidylglycerophosphate synthase [Tenggerimyces flavus]